MKAHVGRGFSSVLSVGTDETSGAVGREPVPLPVPRLGGTDETGTDEARGEPAQAVCGDQEATLGDHNLWRKKNARFRSLTPPELPRNHRNVKCIAEQRH